MGQTAQEVPEPNSEPAKDGNELTLLGHLQELRWRLIRSLVFIAVATGVSFFFADEVFEILKSRVDDLDLIYVEVTELLGVYMRVSLLGGVVLSIPYIVYEAVMFASPALTRREKLYLYLLLPAIVIFFVGGAVFAYYILLPPALRFLINPPFAEGIADPQIRVGNYVSVVTKLIFFVGLSFETPIVILFLTKIGVVHPDSLARWRKYAVLFAFVLAAMITPTFDPINQSLVAVPIFILYELGIWLGRIFGGRREPEELAENEPSGSG
jgi:sec-independent protein translocase protein TatC